MNKPDHFTRWISFGRDADSDAVRFNVWINKQKYICITVSGREQRLKRKPKTRTEREAELGERERE